MKEFDIAIAVAGILATGTLVVAPMAAAAPTGGSNAAYVDVSCPSSDD